MIEDEPSGTVTTKAPDEEYLDLIGPSTQPKWGFHFTRCENRSGLVKPSKSQAVGGAGAPLQTSSSTRSRTAADGSAVYEVIVDSDESDNDADNEKGDDGDNEEPTAEAAYCFLTKSEKVAVTLNLGATAKAAVAPVLPTRRSRFDAPGPSSAAQAAPAAIAAAPKPSQGVRVLPHSAWKAVRNENTSESAGPVDPPGLSIIISSINNAQVCPPQVKDEKFIRLASIIDEQANDRNA